MPESPYPGPPPPHPEPASAPVADAPPPDTTACAVCGAELDPGQTYCLECGSPTPLAPRLRRGAGGLAAVAIGLIVLGAGAGALAYVASQDDGPSQGGIVVPTDRVPTVLTVPTTTTPTTQTDSSLPGDTVATTGTLPADTTFTTPTTGSASTLPMDTTATVPDSGLVTETGPGGGQTTSEFPSSGGSSSGGTTSGTDDWPAGTSGWTAIVSSVRDESAARASASKLASQGQPSGVLWSTDHPPLNPGYWVVFSGTYTTKSEALAQARTLVAQWPGAYPRQVDS